MQKDRRSAVLTLETSQAPPPPSPCVSLLNLRQRRTATQDGLAKEAAEAGHAETQQAQRARYQFFPAQQKTAQPVNTAGVGEGLFHRNLAGQRGEIAVPDVHIDRLAAGGA